ncbi:hypothetical protein KA017_03005 [Candidatus Woesebacteria bacterium]|nr:hypothetical protein [Candidatus Woesebacteria bacterium]
MVSKSRWFLSKIVIPFGVTRLFLLLAGFFSQYVLPVNSGQSEVVRATGLQFSASRLIDMWARWDSGWYLFIIRNGYSSGGSFDIQSSLPFFPGYPMLVKFFTLFFPPHLLTDGVIVLLGIVISNALLLVALVFLYKIARKLSDSGRVADLTIWFILAFPSSFFLSSFYTESLFLCLSVVGYWAALQKKWWLACIMVSLVAVTRNVGMFLAIPVLYEYLKSKNFSVQKIDLSVLWFGVVPVGVGLFFWYLYTLTGDFFAAIKVQEAWGRVTADPVSSLLFPSNFWLHITPVDQFFVVSGLVVCWRLFTEKVLEKGKVLALYSFLLCVPTLFTGTLDSFTRFILVVFPLFIYWASVTKDNKKFAGGAIVVFLVVQMIYFGLFSQFYWAG